MVSPFLGKDCIRLGNQEQMQSFGLIQSALQETLPDTHLANSLIEILKKWFAHDPTCFELGALPDWAFRSAGGDSTKVIPVIAAWQLIRFSAKLFDDIEDGDSLGDLATATNTATSFLFLAQNTLARCMDWGCTAQEYQQLSLELNRACLIACDGQQNDFSALLDRQEPIDPDQWVTIALKKSGELFGWASWAGAFLTHQPPQILAAYRNVGREIGLLLQIADDYRDTWTPRGIGDIFSDRFTLPTSYLFYNVSIEQRENFKQLLHTAAGREEEVRKQILETFDRVGAKKFIIASAYYYYQKVLEDLELTPAKKDLSILALILRIMPALNPFITPDSG